MDQPWDDDEVSVRMTSFQDLWRIYAAGELRHASEKNRPHWQALIHRMEQMTTKEWFMWYVIDLDREIVDFQNYFNGDGGTYAQDLARAIHAPVP
jgi:hypothetical protein